MLELEGGRERGRGKSGEGEGDRVMRSWGGGGGGTEKRPDVACDQKHVTKSGKRGAEPVAVSR